MNELVSICWTTHHEPVEMIQKSLDSIDRQSYDNIEVIMVDDCSEIKGVPEFLDYYVNTHKNKKFIHINLPENVGFARAKNIGASAAKGKYFMFMDADQELVGESIHTAVTMMTDNIVSVAWGYFDDSNKNYYIPSYVYMDAAYEQMGYIGFGIGTCLFHTDIFNHIGHFNTSVDHSDTYFYLIQMNKYKMDNKLESSLIYDNNIYTIDYKDYNRHSNISE